MRKFLWVPIASALIGAAAIAADRVETARNISPAQQKRLDTALAGRVPGEPISCVNMRDLRGNEGFGTDLILFRGKLGSDPVYVNKPAAGCANFNRSSALIVRTPSIRLCRGDIVEVYDPTTNVAYGGCGLGDFTPYERASR